MIDVKTFKVIWYSVRIESVDYFIKMYIKQER